MQSTSPILDIKSGSLFPVHFRVFAILCTIAAVGLFTTNVYVSVVLLLIALGILSGQEGVEFNLAQKTYREYESLFFIKRGETSKYNGVENLYINSGQVSQRIYTAHTAQSAVFSKLEYRGFVTFTNGTKVLLMRSKKKSQVENQLQQAARQFNTTILDYSMENA